VVNPPLTIKPFTEDAPRIERREINCLKNRGAPMQGPDTQLVIFFALRYGPFLLACFFAGRVAALLLQ